MGEIIQYLTTTKHNKAQTLYAYFLGCTVLNVLVLDIWQFCIYHFICTPEMKFYSHVIQIFPKSLMALLSLINNGNILSLKVTKIYSETWLHFISSLAEQNDSNLTLFQLDQ